MKRAFFILSLISVLLICSGCSFDIGADALLQPPKPGGEYMDIQIVLSQYINENHKDDGTAYSDGYILKYPRGGSHDSAFIMQDLDGDGTDEAVVLYQRAKNLNAHMHVLKKVQNQWVSFFDVEGSGTDVERIDFADLRGQDKKNYILTGWTTGVLQNHTLMLYEATDDELVKIPREWAYTELVVSNFRSMDFEDILMMHINSANKECVASLWNFQDKNIGNEADILQTDSPVEIGSTKLDSSISSFSALYVMDHPAKNAERKVLYADALRDKGVLTELICWERNTQSGLSLLTAPFCDNGVTELTYRSEFIPSRAINNSMQLSWPELEYKSSEKSLRELPLTVWKHWDFDKNEVSSDLTYTFMNWPDNYYYLISDAAWAKNHIALYSEQTRIMQIYAWNGGINRREISIKLDTGVAQEPTEAQSADQEADEFAAQRIVLEKNLVLDISVRAQPEQSNSISFERLSTVILPIRAEN